MKKTVLKTILLLIISQIGFAQANFDKTKLNNYFNALEENNKFMGSIAVSKNGQIIYAKTIGFSDVENKVKANETTNYRIGSISKSFTTVLVLKTVEEKKLDLNQTIDKWLPKLINANRITVKHLLSHRSGIHDFTNNSDYLSWITQPKSENEMIKIIENGGSDFEPGSKADYSNSNFVLLTYILEKATKQPYSSLLQKYIVKPIGLINTFFGKSNPYNHVCKSYSFVGTWKLETETNFTIPLGAGAIISTPSDLTKFADALFNGKLLNSESVEMMKTIKDDYGIGLFKIPFQSYIGYGHTGGIDGFRSVFAHYDEDNISYALISNGTNFNFKEVSVAVLSAIFNKPYEIPTFKSYNLSSEELDKYCGIYASNQIALKITITSDGKTLIAKGTNQPAFSLEATEKDKFKFDRAGVKFEFNSTEKTMILFQGGGKVIFQKE